MIILTVISAAMIKSKAFLSRTCLFKECRMSSNPSNYQQSLRTKLEPVKMTYTSYESFTGCEEKPPVIIMHGLFGSKSNWHSLSKAIHDSTRRKVITADARNHGDSPHTPELNYQLMAEDLKRLMKELNLKKASLIGHSMGGRTIMYMALVCPELVESLIIVDISPINSRNLNDIHNIIKALKSINLDSNAPISEVRKLADKQLKSSIGSPILRQFLLTNIIQVDNKYRWRLNLESVNDHFEEYLSNFPAVRSAFHGPTYFIAGGNSTFLDPADHEAVKRIFPSAEFDYVPGAGHWPHAEKPNEFLKLVGRFLSAV